MKSFGQSEQLVTFQARYTPLLRVAVISIVVAIWGAQASLNWNPRLRVACPVRPEREAVEAVAFAYRGSSKILNAKILERTSTGPAKFVCFETAEPLLLSKDDWYEVVEREGSVLSPGYVTWEVPDLLGPTNPRNTPPECFPKFHSCPRLLKAPTPTDLPEIVAARLWKPAQIFRTQLRQSNEPSPSLLSAIHEWYVSPPVERESFLGLFESAKHTQEGDPMSIEVTLVNDATGKHHALYFGNPESDWDCSERHKLLNGSQ